MHSSTKVRTESESEREGEREGERDRARARERERVYSERNSITWSPVYLAVST